MTEMELGIPYAPVRSPIEGAATTGIAFMIGAPVPVLPYLFLTMTAGPVLSVVLTLGALFVMGVLPSAPGLSPAAG